MAVTAKYYGKWFDTLHRGLVNIEEDDVKAMLCTSSYTPDQDTHQWKSDVTNEVSGTGYTAGGKLVPNISLSYNGTTNVLSYDADDIAWTSATLIGANAPRYLVLYVDLAGSDSSKPLIGYVDFGDDSYAPNGGTLSIAWNANGVASVTVA